MTEKNYAKLDGMNKNAADETIAPRGLDLVRMQFFFEMAFHSTEI